MADITNEIPNIPKKYFYKNAKLGKNGSDEPINQTLDQLGPIDVSPDMAYTNLLLDKYKCAVLPGSLFYD